MEYVKPLNEADANAPYIDGDASQDIEGSEVPAAAIEQPMREIVNAITFFLGTVENPTPASNEDLQQLRKAIQKAVSDANLDALFRNVSATVTKGFYTTPVDLTIAAGEASFDPTASNRFKHTVTGTLHITAPDTEDMPPAGPVKIKLKMDGVGGHGISWDNKYRRIGAVSSEAGVVNNIWMEFDADDDVIDVTITQRPGA